MSSETIPISSKPRFEILDGLRGVAAMIVVAFHLFETYSSGPADQILNHGYLAVDFFFVLSGFVIGYAYDDRWGTRMTTWDFFKRRLIRLQPMVVLGTLIGAFWFYFGGAPGFELVMQTPWWKLLLIMVLGCIMFPTPPSMDIRGWQEINSLNGAQWSLMWEYVANILYTLVVRRFGKLLLALFVLLSAFLTVDLALNLDVTGLLELRSYARYTVIGGFGLTPDQIYVGLCRLLYPFFGGLLLYRMSKWRLRIPRGGMTWCSLAVAATLVIPHIGGEDRPWLNGLYCAVVILAVYPAIVAAGAGNELKGKRTTAVCKFLGMISYPLYITHYPMIYVQMNWAAQHADAPLGTHIWVAVSIFIASVAIAYASVKVYDIPIREWLSRKFLRRPLSSKTEG
ncbi:MAG: acyltransferase [Bacteroides sp.]|nr:acyltransferase [Bacteroides sp.]